MGARDHRQKGREIPREADPSTGGLHPNTLIAHAIQRKLVMRKAAQGGARRNVAIPEGGGAPLAPEVRKEMEGELGADFSQVSIHTGSDSQEAAAGLQAKAFTDGSRVHFAGGQFAPGTKEGDHLLAHELTHVAQGQQAGVQRKAEVSSPDDPAEIEADAVGDQVADRLHGQGGSPPPSIGQMQQGQIHRATDPAATSFEEGEVTEVDPQGAAPGAEPIPEEDQFDMSNWDVGKRLVVTGNANLYELINKDEPTKKLAMKVLTKDNLEAFKKEFAIQKQLSQGPNIGGVEGRIKHGSKDAIVMPLYKNGSLTKASNELRLAWANDRIDDEQFYGVLAYWTQGILRGLEHIHGQQFQHSDIKPDNVMLDDQYEPQIIDFGTAAQVGEGKPGHGTPEFAPPEQMDKDGTGPTQADDMFALGKTLQMMAEGQCEGPPAEGACSGFVKAATNSDPEQRPKVSSELQVITSFNGPALSADKYLEVMKSVLAPEPPPVPPGNAPGPHDTQPLKTVENGG